MTEYRPSVPNLKKIIMHKWYLIENQPLLREVFKDPPIISYKRGKSLQDILNKEDKMKEGEIQLDDRQNYKPLETPMVVETSERVKKLIDKHYKEKHIDEMTRRWLSLMPNPPRIQQFYTLTKIHKPTPVGRPIISGCEGPTERISSFVDSLLQPKIVS